MTTFRNGDRVKVVNNNSARMNYTGREGTVKVKTSLNVGVLLDGESAIMYFDPSELASALDPRDAALDLIAEAFEDSEMDDHHCLATIRDALWRTGREVV